MSLKTWGMIALGTVAAFAAGAPASAQSAQAVEHSGRTFHVAVCARNNPRGTARCFAHVVTDAHGNPINGKLNPGATALPSGYGPADLRSAYKITTNGTATIAIVDSGGYSGAESDLAVYRSTYGLPACTTANGCFKKLNQSGVQGSYPRNDSGWSQESALDLDMASAMCPGCKLILVEANSATLANLAAAAQTAAKTGALVISNSYGGSESGSTSYAAAYNQPGKAVTVSTGDSGYGVQFPASAPTVIAVGGTHLVKAANTRGWTETAWSSGGSGCSTTYAKPSFETDTLCTKRMEADVSAVGDPNTGVAVYGPNHNASQWMVFGGTSVAAPLIGGIYGVTGHGPGDAHTLWANLGNASTINDVTSGTNGSCGGTYYCTAQSGYDGPTGVGTPNGTGAF